MPFTDANEVEWIEGADGARSLSATVNGHAVVVTYTEDGTHWWATIDGGEPQVLAVRDLPAACEAADALAFGM